MPVMLLDIQSAYITLNAAASRWCSQGARANNSTEEQKQHARILGSISFIAAQERWPMDVSAAVMTPDVLE